MKSSLLDVVFDSLHPGWAPLAALGAIHLRRKWERDKNTCDAHREEPVGRPELRVAAGRAETNAGAAWSSGERRGCTDRPNQ